MEVKCVVACHNASGEPDFFFCVVRVTPGQYEEGEHYDAARELTGDEGYEGPYVVYDEHDGPAWLFERFVWESASLVAP